MKSHDPGFRPLILNRMYKEVCRLFKDNLLTKFFRKTLMLIMMTLNVFNNIFMVRDIVLEMLNIE